MPRIPRFPHNLELPGDTSKRAPWQNGQPVRSAAIAALERAALWLAAYPPGAPFQLLDDRTIGVSGEVYRHHIAIQHYTQKAIVVIFVGGPQGTITADVTSDSDATGWSQTINAGAGSGILQEIVGVIDIAGSAAAQSPSWGTVEITLTASVTGIAFGSLVLPVPPVEPFGSGNIS